MPDDGEREAVVKTLPAGRYSPAPDWPRYERLKREFRRLNPNATAAEYDAAIRKIVERCGV